MEEGNYRESNNGEKHTEEGKFKENYLKEESIEEKKTAGEEGRERGRKKEERRGAGKKQVIERGRFPNIPDWLETFAAVAGAVYMGLILIIVVFWGDAEERLTGNGYLMLIVLPAVLGAGILYAATGGKKAVKRPVLRLLLGYLALYVIQMLLLNCVYFYCGWDAGWIRWSAEGIINGGNMYEISTDIRYSTYPNNLLLFYICCLVEKAGMLLSMSEPYLLFIALGCLCVNLSCFIGNLMMRRLTESRMIRGCYTFLSTVMILFSPWITIPYSDTFGMFFVLLGMWGLLCVDRKYLKWIVTAGASVIGYYIKPTCIFPLFAAYLVFGVRYLLSLRRNWKELCALVLGTVFFAGIGMLIPVWIQHTYSFRLIPEVRIPYTHYLMMGFHEGTRGMYNGDDFNFSAGFPNVESRMQANRAVFRRRLEEMAAGGRLGRFLKDKTLVTFNDGTFAWWREGEFISSWAEHDNILNDWFHDTFVPPGIYEEDEGRYYYVFRTAAQGLWLWVLTGIPFAAMDRKRNRREKACMMIVLCGLAFFLLLFEARARYLFLYAPVFVILALCGYEELWRRVFCPVYATWKGGRNEDLLRPEKTGVIHRLRTRLKKV